MRGVAWTGLQFIAALIWIAIGSWLVGLLGIGLGGVAWAVLSLSPLVVVGVVAVVAHRRDRKRLLDQEFSE